MAKPKYPKEFLELCASVTGKRPKTVIDHILKHGHITTEELKNKYGYESKLWHDEDYPKIQILITEALLNGKERVEAPPQVNPFVKVQREAEPE